MTTDQTDLRTLLDTGHIAGLDVSPDGRFVTFGSTKEGTSRIYVQPIDGGEPRAVTKGEEGAQQPKWSPRGNLIAYLQDVGEDENYGVYVVSPQGGEARDVTHAPGSMHESPNWSWDGTRIIYVSTRDGGFDVYYSDVASGTVHRVTDYPAVHHSPTFAPDGERIAFASNRSEHRGNWDTFVKSLRTGEETKITHHDGPGDEMSYYANQWPYWSPDGRRVLIASGLSGNYDIYAIEVDTLLGQPIATSPCDEENAQWSPDGTHVAYIVNADGNLRIHVKNIDDCTERPVSQPEGVAGHVFLRGMGGGFSWTPDGKSIVYSYEGPDEAGSIWIAASDGSGEPRPIYRTLGEDIDRTQLVRPQSLRYRSFDDREIHAFLYLPPAARRPLPAVVLVHGGPYHQTMNGWDPTIQYLVRKGYAVLAPNFRGSTGYGRDFQMLNHNDWGGGDLRDVVAAADWLSTEGIADRIGITGGSYGGFLTMSAVTKYPDRWAAAVGRVPPVDLMAMHAGARPDMRRFIERSIGAPDEGADFYVERSPVNFADRVRCPVLMLLGERDPRVPLAAAERMRDRFREAGIEHEFVVYPNQGHYFTSTDAHHDSTERLVAWFDRHMAPAAVNR